MLMHIIQLTEEEDESYEFQDNSEESDAYINIYQVARLTKFYDTRNSHN